MKTFKCLRCDGEMRVKGTEWYKPGFADHSAVCAGCGATELIGEMPGGKFLREGPPPKALLCAVAGKPLIRLAGGLASIRA